jgi:small-conductance mechanosensitive channel
MADFANVGGSLVQYGDGLLLVLKIALILTCGYFIGRIANRFVITFGRKTIAWRMDDIDVRETRFGSKYDLIEISGSIAKYFIYLISLIIVFDQLGLTVMRDMLVELWHYFPHIIASFLIVVVGAILADLAGKVVRMSLVGAGMDELFKEAGQAFLPSRFFGAVVRYFIYLLSATMALTQLGFQTLLLTIIVGSSAVIFTLFVFAMVGFGLKGMLPDIFAGIYLRSSGFVKIGETVEVGEFRGKVKSIGLLAVTVESGSQKFKAPNSLVLQGIKTISGK